MKFRFQIIILLVLVTVVSCGGGGGSSSSNSSSNIDSTPPEITLNGDSDIELEFGSTYVELGASAVDETDGAVNVAVSGVVLTTSVGDYIVTYSATDTSGNSSSITRSVSVIDNEPPSIALNGAALLELDFGMPYVELGAIAIDNADSDVPVNINGTVLVNTIGSYEIAYLSTDSSGNSASTVRTVNVIDRIEPDISLIGEASVIIYLGNEYTEEGATAIDNVDGDISSAVTIVDNLNIRELGSYQVTYSVIDSNGNSNSVIREVEIREPDSSFILSDNDMTLWEASYVHRFSFTFNQVEPVAKQLSISIAATSTATEGADFNLVTTEINEPENSTGSYIELQVLDDRESEGDEFIDLIVQDSRGDLVDNIQILLNDQTSDVITHNNISGSHFAPSSSVIGDDLFITSQNRIERYNLLTESTTANSAFSPGITFGYGDSITYDGQIYLFASGVLYLVDEVNFQYLVVSTSPQFVEWTSEIQVIGDKLYIVGGRTSSSVFTSNLVVIYDFETDLWTYGQSASNDISGSATAVFGNDLYIFGGNGSSGASEVYSSLLDVWSPLSSNTFLSGQFDTAVNVGQYIFVSRSDFYADAQSLILRYDISSDVWQSYNIDTEQRQYRDSFLYKGRIYMVGGTGEGVLTSNVLVSFYIGD